MSAAAARWHGPTDRKKLIAGIHAQAHALKLDDDTRRDLQQQLVGKSSTKDMTQSQLTKVWQRLTDLANESGLSPQSSALSPRSRRPGRDERLPDEPVTPEQLEKIKELFAAIDVQDSALRMQLCRRACRRPWAQTRAEGNQIIEMLKQMGARGWRPKGTGIVEPPPCSLPAHNQNVLGQCAQVEAGSTLPDEKGEAR